MEYIQPIICCKHSKLPWWTSVLRSFALNFENSYLTFSTSAHTICDHIEIGYLKKEEEYMKILRSQLPNTHKCVLR